MHSSVLCKHNSVVPKYINFWNISARR